MKNRKKMMLFAAAVLSAAALFAGCTTASAVSPESPQETLRNPYITMEQARAIAYAHAGVDEAQAVDKSYDFDDGYYEIDFEHDGWDYEYDISSNGEILKSEKEPDEDRPVETKPVETQPAETVPAVTQPQRITREEAIAAACAHAGVSRSDVWDLSCEWDDGCYEVDFNTGSYEYDYEISSSGAVLRVEKDWEDDHHDHDHDHDDHHH